ncbi:glypican-1-like, partial [Terrapene carolina triunguis]|uniref:glypican-1-like n=1 Tax=Terrapene triunguis TaxID=2587831 RepID=UPI0011561E43
MKGSHTTLQMLGLYVPPAKDKPRPHTSTPQARGRYESPPKKQREQRFCSRVGEGDGAMTDAFLLNWSGPLMYAFPPFPLIGRVLQKVKSDGARIILIAPDWARQHWDLSSSEDGGGSDSGSDFEDTLWKGGKRGTRTPLSCTLVTDVKEKLRLMRGFWVTLPHTLCSDGKVAADVTDEDKCWNGQARGRYLPDVTGDGLVNQINNPEVEVDIGRPDLLTRQHILQLRVATSRLQGAYGGQDLDFQDTYEDGSGSGGGERYSEDWPGGGGGGSSHSGSRPPDSRSHRKDRPGKGSRQNHRVRGSSNRAVSWGGPALPLLLLPALALPLLGR